MPAPIPVDYAGHLGQAGVRIDWEPDRLRVVILPLPSWRYLNRYYLFGLIPAVMSVVMVAQGVFAHNLSPTIFRAAEFLFIAVAVLIAAMNRLTTRALIDVTATSLTLARQSGRLPPNVASWSKKRITEVKVNPINHKLHFRIADQGILEVFVPGDASVAEAVAKVLSEALLNENFAAPAQPQPPVARTAHPAVKPTRNGMGIVVSIGLAAIMLVATAFRAEGLVCLGLFCCSIVAGILLGTQEKDFFF